MSRPASSTISTREQDALDAVQALRVELHLGPDQVPPYRLIAERLGVNKPRAGKLLASAQQKQRRRGGCCGECGRPMGGD